MADIFGTPGDCCYDAIEEASCRLFCDPNNLDWVGVSSFVDSFGEFVANGGVSGLENGLDRTVQVPSFFFFFF